MMVLLLYNINSHYTKNIFKDYKHALFLLVVEIKILLYNTVHILNFISFHGIKFAMRIILG